MRDNGSGLPEHFDLSTSDHLGLQIVKTLVSIELGGELDVRANPEGAGTEVGVNVPPAVMRGGGRQNRCRARKKPGRGRVSSNPGERRLG